MTTKRKFTFDSRVYEIVEIITNSDISMDWNWGSIMCPHCKKKIDKIVNHKFDEIEILVPEILLEQKVNKNILLKEIRILGKDKIGKKLLLNKETEKKVLEFSNYFKEVI